MKCTTNSSKMSILLPPIVDDTGRSTIQHKLTGVRIGRETIAANITLSGELLYQKKNDTI